MIKSYDDLLYYLKKDKEALNITRRRPKLIGDDIWKFQIALRKHEYYNNCKSGGVKYIKLQLYKFLHYYYGVKLGFSIPINTFEEGLRINHYGLIVVNPKVRIGKFCDIHQGVNIGQNIEPDSVPVIGNNAWIGPGVKIFGKIKLGNSICIGANAVVNKSFLEDNITIAGIPAHKVKDVGEPYKRK